MALQRTNPPDTAATIVAIAITVPIATKAGWNSCKPRVACMRQYTNTVPNTAAQIRIAASEATHQNRPNDRLICSLLNTVASESVSSDSTRSSDAVRFAASATISAQCSAERSASNQSENATMPPTTGTASASNPAATTPP